MSDDEIKTLYETDRLHLTFGVIRLELWLEGARR